MSGFVIRDKLNVLIEGRSLPNISGDLHMANNVMSVYCSLCVKRPIRLPPRLARIPMCAPE